MVDCSELVRQIGDLLKLRRWMLATAESCTGGLVGHYMTAISGSSDYYQGGVIAYANEIKQALLSVPAELLYSVGAVSAEVALAMARGVCVTCNAQVGLSSTGIAGPTGGTLLKPVGTVFIGYSGAKGTKSVRLNLPGDRYLIRWRSSQAALDYLRRQIMH